MDDDPFICDDPVLLCGWSQDELDDAAVLLSLSTDQDKDETASVLLGLEDTTDSDDDACELLGLPTNCDDPVIMRLVPG